MPLITDPDLLNQATEVVINTTAKTIALSQAGNLSTDGVTLKALYSFLKEEWKNDAALIKFPFPMEPITDEQFDLIRGWDFANDASRYLIRTGGWAVRNTSNVATQMWASIIGLGAIESNDQLYFQQATGGAAANVQLQGQINQAVQILRDDDGDAIYAEASDFDRRAYFSLFVREPSQLYGKATLTDIGVTGMTYQAYRFPISTGTDLKIAHNDAFVSKSVPVATSTWAANVLTVNTGAVHGLVTGDYVRITGASPATYNVRGVATVVDTDTFTLSLTSNPGAYTSGGSVQTLYSFIKVRYFDQAFSRDVDSTTDRNFGIVVDVGTHSGVDGSVTSAGTVLTTVEGGVPIENDYFAGGTLKIHEGTAAGTYNIASATATTITITGATFPATNTNASFTAYPATAVPATAEQIYTGVQYQLRLNTDIDATDQSVIGKTADQVMYFVGDTLVSGRAASGTQPTNPNGGGSGVVVEGFATSDTNRLQFFDNTNTQRTFPYVATLTINFGDNLKDDAASIYRVFFTNDDAGSNLGNDYGTSGAILVDNAAGVDMAGLVSGASSVTLSYDYDGNVQRGAGSGGTDVPITVVGIGLNASQFVVATGVIARSTSNSISLVPARERNYSNL